MENNQTTTIKGNYTDKPILFVEYNDRYELTFAGPFEDEKTSPIITQLYADLRSGNKWKTMYVYINSYGGLVSTVASIIPYVKSYSYVITVAESEISSAGFLLWACGDNRYVHPHTNALYHDLSMIVFGKPTEIKHATECAFHTFQSLQHTYCDCLKHLTPEEIKLSKTSEVYITGEELVKRGMATGYIDDMGKRPKITISKVMKIASPVIQDHIMIIDDENPRHAHVYKETNIVDIYKLADTVYEQNEAEKTKTEANFEEDPKGEKHERKQSKPKSKPKPRKTKE